jgi:dsDNA-specific endonuclease/ATPase MutS2
MLLIFMTLLEWLKRWRARSTHTQDKASPDSVCVEDDESVDPFNPFPEPVTIEITDIIDLHTVNPREVRKVVEEYLLEARRKGFRSVRIIHGKGAGVQRQVVRSILKRTPFVTDWTDAPAGGGGWGATVAQLSPADD